MYYKQAIGGCKESLFKHFNFPRVSKVALPYKQSKNIFLQNILSHLTPGTDRFKIAQFAV